MKIVNDILYSKAILNIANDVIIDGEVVKSRGNEINNLSNHDLNKIIMSKIQNENEDIIVIQEGRIQNIYGPKDKLNNLINYLEDFPFIKDCIDNKLIRFNKY